MLPDSDCEEVTTESSYHQLQECAFYSVFVGFCLESRRRLSPYEGKKSLPYTLAVHLDQYQGLVRRLRIKTLSAKPDDLSSISRTQMVEAENHFPQVVLSVVGCGTHRHMRTCTHIHTTVEPAFSMTRPWLTSPQSMRDKQHLHWPEPQASVQQSDVKRWRRTSGLGPGGPCQVLARLLPAAAVWSWAGMCPPH